MATDFANGPRRTRDVRRDPRARPRQRQSAFHPGSFGAGLALGIAFTLAVALLPEWWRSAAAQTTTPPAEAVAEPVPVTRFEFFDKLPGDTVAAHERSDPDHLPTAVNEPPREFLLQAGSFTNDEDAQRLRASLSLLGLNCATATVTLSSGAVRHRVIVGPFVSAAEAQRAMTRLRDQNIEALVLTRRPAAG
jgi:cell division protein FtsN